MKFNVTIKDGAFTVTDASTGAAIDWIETVDVVLPAGGPPILYLGTTHLTASFDVGPTATVPAPGGGAK